MLQVATVLAIRFQVGDVVLFEGAGNYLREGIDFYWIDSDHSQYPFFPLMIFMYALLGWLHQVTGLLTFSAWLKLSVLLPAVYGLSWWVYREVSGSVGKKRLAVLFLLSHPVLFGTLLFHAQTDVVLLVTAVWGLTLMFQKKRLRWVGAVLVWLSIAIKTWAVIFFPLFIRRMGWKRGILYILMFAGGLLLLVKAYTAVVFGSSVWTVVPAVLRPGGPIGIWGVTAIASFVPELLPVVITIKSVYLLLIGLFLLGFYSRIHFQSWVNDALFWVLGFLIFTPQFGIQYLLWIWPFLLVRKDFFGSKFTQYSIFSGIFILFSYGNIVSEGAALPVFLVRSLGLLVWGMIISLWLTLIFQGKK